MGIGANAETVRRFFRDVPSGGNLALAEELYAPDARYSFPGHAEPHIGPEAVKRAIASLRGSFPDLRVTVEETVSEGDAVAARVSVRGTHRGEYMGVAPTGRAVAWEALHLFRFAGGRIAEHRVSFDRLFVRGQLDPTEGDPPPRR